MRVTIRSTRKILGPCLVVVLALGGCGEGDTDYLNEHENGENDNDEKDNGENGNGEPPCDVPGLRASGVLDFELETVNVGGEVTVDGKVMPSSGMPGYERAYLRFQDRKTGSNHDVALGESGPADYASTLFTGDYKVYLVPNSHPYQDVLPESLHILNHDVSLREAGVLDFDIKTVDISGEVRLNAETMPSSTTPQYERAHIRFVDRVSGGTSSVSLGGSGAGAYAITLFEGVYDIYFIPNGHNFQDVLPASSLLLKEDVSLSQSGVFDFDLETVDVSGEVTLRGAAMPASSTPSYERAHISFTDRVSGGSLSVTLDGSGEATYAATLFKGRYDIRLVPNGPSFQDVLPASMLLLAEDTSLMRSGVLDFDLETVDVAGEVTLDGAMLPTSSTPSYERAHLYFTDRASGGLVSIPLGGSGTATYEATLFAGDYEVHLQPNGRSYQDVLPLNLHLLLRACD